MYSFIQGQWAMPLNRMRHRCWWPVGRGGKGEGGIGGDGVGGGIGGSGIEGVDDEATGGFLGAVGETAIINSIQNLKNNILLLLLVGIK